MNDSALTPDRLRALLVDFKKRHGEQYKLRTLGYFGSYARGAATPGSDVDILFDTDAPNLFMTAMMKQDLEKFLGCSVDASGARIDQSAIEGKDRERGRVCMTGRCWSKG